MADIISISLPDGCQLLNNAKKGYGAGTSVSHIIRDALTLLIEKNQSGESVVPLPTWKQFDKILTDASDVKFNELYKRVKQLQMIADAKRNYRSKVNAIKA